MGKTGRDAVSHSFTLPLSFRPVINPFETFVYPWDAQAGMLILFCLLNGFSIKKVFKNTTQRCVLRLDSYEWQGVWDSMGKYLNQWAPTESQNHRMLWVGRDLCGSSSPILLPKQGHLQKAAQDLVQVGLEYLQRRRIHNLPGEPVSVLCHSQREEILPHLQTELPVPQFVPIAPCPVTGHH